MGRTANMSMAPFLKPYRKQLIVGPLFKLLEAVLELLLPTLMSLLIDQGVRNHDQSYILNMGGQMLLTAVVGIASALICQYSASIASQGFGTRLRNELFNRINHLDVARVERIGTSSLTNRITNDVNTLQQGVAMLIRLVIRAPFLCIGGFVMAVLLHAKLAMIVLAGIFLFLVVMIFIMRWSVPRYKGVQARLDTLSRILRENLSGVRVIRAFSRVDHERQRFREENSQYRQAAERVGRVAAALNPTTLLILNTGIVAVLWFGGVVTDRGEMSPGQIIAFTTYLTYILQALLVVATLVQLYTRAFASLGRVNEILDMPTEETVNLPAKHQKAMEKKTLRFERVSFAYEGAGEDALSDIDFTLNSGETLGIIGGTGSGKTTLVQLIPRFFDATKGSISWGGRDIREWDVAALRQSIGMAMQKPLLFQGSVESNIRWGKPDATDEEIREAARAAQAAEFIEAMRYGYCSVIDRGGANLSGGQRQRLNMARALVRKPELLILDDSSSALDYATDARLRTALRQYQGQFGMSVIVVSQRISSIRNADCILLLDEGRCIGMGDHETLLRENAVYQELCEIQSIQSRGAQA